MLTPKDLSPHQIQCYKDILINKTLCIKPDCGFGKTICALTAYAILKKRSPKSIALIVCTPEGVKKTWSHEHKNWSHTKNIKIMPLLGTPEERLRKLKVKSDIYIISYHNLGWLEEHNNHIKFKFVFADEGDCLKGVESQWRRNLINCAPFAKYKVISSATPKTREEDDYWGLCKYLDNGKCLNAETATEFRARYCKSFTIGRRQIWKVDKTKVDEIESRIQHLFFDYELSDKATIEIKTKTCYATLSDAAQLKYDTLQNDQCINSIIYTDRGVRDEKKSLDAVTLSGKLAQLANGFIYMDEHVRITPELLMKTTNIKALLKQTKKRVAVDVFNDRLKAFKRMLKLIHKIHGQDESVIVCYFHKHELTQLKRLLPNSTCDTDEDYERKWNAGKVKYLLLQYNRSSKSLNLQYGGHIMAFYSPTFRWVDDYQIIRRLARQGQTKPIVYAYRLYIKNTIDELKTKRLKERFKGHLRFQKKILNRLRR